jgi:hypothetical protein
MMTVLLLAALAAPDGPVYVAYYWRARPDKLAEYNAYIKEYAEPIDEEARKAGAFEEVRTYVRLAETAGPSAEWTHLRVFKVKDAAAADALAAALDAATKRLRDEAERKAASERSAALRDFVRQERWSELGTQRNGPHGRGVRGEDEELLANAHRIGVRQRRIDGRRVLRRGSGRPVSRRSAGSSP